MTVYAFGLLINLSRGLFKIHSLVLKNKWEKYSGVELLNKNLGIIGFGNIGENIAKVGTAFGMNILINDSNKKLKSKVLKYGYSFISKSKILKKSDFLILATDLNKSSFHLLDFKEFKMIKKNAIFGSHNAFNTKEAVNRTNDDCVLNLIKALKK